MHSSESPGASGKREVSYRDGPCEPIPGIRERIRYMHHADKQKEHQSEQGGRQAHELPCSKTGGCGEQCASDKIRPEQVGRHPGRDDSLNRLWAADVVSPEYCERNGEEDTAQGDELVPARSRGNLFSKYKNSGEKIDNPGKRHPVID